MSPTLNDGWVLFLLWWSWCDCRLSSTRIWTIERANWDSLDTSLRYWYRCELDSSLSVGDGLSSTSNGNLNALPTAAKLLTTSVPSIGALFQANWAVFAVRTNPLCVPLSVPSIVSTLLRNRWKRSTINPLWFDRASTQYWYLFANQDDSVHSTTTLQWLLSSSAYKLLSISSCL